MNKQGQELYDSLPSTPTSMQGGFGSFIKANGETTHINPENGKNFTLKELQKFVGGYIELIHFEHTVMVVNEEGRLNNLPINEKATDIYFKRFGDRSGIVGDVFLCPSEMIN